MPAAAKGGPVPQRIATARNQKDILDSVEANPRTAIELAKDLHLSTHVVGEAMRELWEAGLIQLTGEQRKNAPVYEIGDGIPNPREVPAEFADMPAAASDAPLAVKITQAMQQRRVADAAAAHGVTFVISEFEGYFPDWPRSRTQAHLNELAEDGRFVKRTGNFRHPKGTSAGEGRGRTSVEYVFSGDEVEVPVTRKAEPEPAAEEPEPAPTVERGPDSPSEAEVRDVVLKHRDEKLTRPFLATRLGVDSNDPILIMRLDSLERRGTLTKSLEQVGQSRIFIYEYASPEGGAPAVRPRSAEAPGRAQGGAPVPGTGKAPVVTDADVRKLVKDAQAAGATVQSSGGGHLKVSWDGQSRTIASTPGSRRTVLNDRTLLRQAGLKV